MIKAAIQSVAAIKRRSKPDSVSHESVGTESQVLARAESRKKIAALRLTAGQLEPYLLTMDQMKQWGYVVEIPPGPGGNKPHEEGGIMTCERCTQKFVVKRRDDADQCRFHWGKAFSSKANGKLSSSRDVCVDSHSIRCRREEARVYLLLSHSRRRGVRSWPTCIL